MYLFVIYIGGGHKNALIELHDMRLIAAERIEDTYEVLRRSWWGEAKTLHLDAWGVLEYADGYKIILKDRPPINNFKKLYFVNLGGYDSKQFTELHRNIFVVAEDEKAAKARALKTVQAWQVPHRDYLFEAEKIIEVNKLISNLYIHLEESNIIEEFVFTTKYVPINL